VLCNTIAHFKKKPGGSVLMAFAILLFFSS